MNIKPVNTSNASFGKISWGTPEKAHQTETALITIKEANDIDEINLLKFSDVEQQLIILSEHPDIFEVSCSITKGNHDAYFNIRVFENDTRELIGSFGEYYTADYKSGGLKTPQKRDINSFAQSVFDKHKSVTIKREITSLMNKLGLVNSNK